MLITNAITVKKVHARYAHQKACCMAGVDASRLLAIIADKMEIPTEPPIVLANITLEVEEPNSLRGENSCTVNKVPNIENPIPDPTKNPQVAR